MRIIKLPKEISIRCYVDEQPKTKESGESLAAEMADIDKNGYEILSAAIMLEDRMIEAVSLILFGSANDNSENRSFFQNEIIGTSDFSFAFKRRVFTRLLESKKLLSPEKVKVLKAGLNKLMEWRNAFAHGQIIHERNGGFVLRYYSGGYKEFVLDDEYFEKVELTIRDCLYSCNDIIQSQ